MQSGQPDTLGCFDAFDGWMHRLHRYRHGIIAIEAELNGEVCAVPLPCFGKGAIEVNAYGGHLREVNFL
jgi:hypothetical protein